MLAQYDFGAQIGFGFFLYDLAQAIVEGHHGRDIHYGDVELAFDLLLVALENPREQRDIPRAPP